MTHNAEYAAEMLRVEVIFAVVETQERLATLAASPCCVEVIYLVLPPSTFSTSAAAACAAASRAVSTRNGEHET